MPEGNRGSEQLLDKRRRQRMEREALAQERQRQAPIALWLIASWLPGILFWPLNLAIEIPCYLVIARQRPLTARRLWCFSSSIVIPALMVLSVLWNYPQAQARVLHVGLMPDTNCLLDPQTRLHPGSVGCTADGFSTLLMASNNLAVYSLHYIFGPPAAAYRGPFPTRAQAAAALSSDAGVLSAAELDSGRFQAGSRAVLTEPGLAGRLRRFMHMPAAMLQRCELAVFQERCLIVQVLGDAGQFCPAILVDLKSGRPFHYYSSLRSQP